MRSILLLATAVTAKPLFEEAPAFPPFARNDGGDAPRQFDFHTGEMSGARSRTVLLVEFMETHKVSPLWHVGLGGPCGSARKNKVPTRADLCYGVVDREIVATKCA